MNLLREPGVLAIVLISAVWYWRGSRRSRLHVVGKRPHREVPWRGISFGTALVALVVALDSPLERAADDRFWAHMVQHVLLMLVVAPLLVLGAPWMPFWRPLPLAFRRMVARAVVKGRLLAWLRIGAEWIAAPIPAWLVFNLDVGLWHVPYFYDLTLRNTAVHYVEHVSFVVFGMLFWAQLIDSPPFHARLQPFVRAVYAGAGSAATWLLAVVLELATSPIYPAQHTGRGGISALTDQQLAAGVMIGPGSVPYAIVFFYWLYVWLGAEEPRRRRRLRHAPVS
jgi:putative membrane protein